VGSLADKLRAALNLPAVAPPGPIQTLYNRFKYHLNGKIIESPLPESVHLLSINFFYWVKLEYPNLAIPGQWVQAKPSVVLPTFENGTFDETGFRVDENRSASLFNLPNLLRNPNCIHGNLRDQEERGLGGIKGAHIYVRYHSRSRTVAFTEYSTRVQKTVVVSSFTVSSEWVSKCADMPAKYTEQGFICRCK